MVYDSQWVSPTVVQEGRPADVLARRERVGEVHEVAGEEGLFYLVFGEYLVS